MRGLLVGRFQPFHNGHLAIVKEIRRRRPRAELLLGIGSAQAGYTPDNPFTCGERFEMIERALEGAKLDGCRPVPLVDIDRHPMWVAHVVSLLPRFDRVYTNNPLTRRLFEAGGYRVDSTALYDRPRFEGANVRAHLLAGSGWRPLVPPAVAAYLAEIDATARLRDSSGGLPRRRGQRR